MKIVQPTVSMEYITPNALQEIERAGRTCYKSESKINDTSAAAFVKKILDLGHESVIEHPYASFRVVTDRGVSHEFVRHRLMSYSQESTRYCNYGKGKFGGEVTFIKPPGLDTPAAEGAWRGACSFAEGAYLELLNQGVPPQIARGVLPNSLKTEFVATANFREWRHFIMMRTSPRAHPQMRLVACTIALMLREQYPSVFTLGWTLDEKKLGDAGRLEEAVDELKKALICLYLEAHADVCNDIRAKAERVFKMIVK